MAFTKNCFSFKPTASEASLSASQTLTTVQSSQESVVVEVDPSIYPTSQLSQPLLEYDGPTLEDVELLVNFAESGGSPKSNRRAQFSFTQAHASAEKFRAEKEIIHTRLGKYTDNDEGTIRIPLGHLEEAAERLNVDTQKIRAWESQADAQQAGILTASIEVVQREVDPEKITDLSKTVDAFDTAAEELAFDLFFLNQASVWV